MKGDTILFTSSCVVTMQKQTLSDVMMLKIIGYYSLTSIIMIFAFLVTKYCTIFGIRCTHRYEVNFYKIKNTIEFLTILLQ